MAGRSFNLNSPIQLREILYTERGLAPGKKTKTGYSTDAATLEKLRDQYSKEADPAKQKAIVEELQKYWAQNPTHINVGQWYAPAALRTSLDGLMTTPVPVFWNISKK